MIRFIKNLLGLTPKTPEQRAFAEFNDLMEVMREHYAKEVHASYEQMVNEYAANHPLVDAEIVTFYTNRLNQFLSEVGGFYYQ